MKITPSHIVFSLVALVVGAAGARFWIGRPRPPFDADGTNAILVGPLAQQVSIPNAYLWQNSTQNDVAVWAALDPSAALYIDFKDEIFEGMTRQSNGLWRVKCVGSRCDSGTLKTGVKHGDPGFTYDQTLVFTNGKTDHADGRIIIKP